LYPGTIYHSNVVQYLREVCLLEQVSN